MSRRKITFAGAAIDFEEWLEPGGNEPNRPVQPVGKNADDPTADNRIFYQSFGSGSSGNCCYVGTANSGLLIDAGIREDAVVAMLRSNGIGMGKVKGILLTHDHNDHVKYVYKLLRNHKGISLFCTNRVMNGILRHHNVSSRLKDYHVPIFKEIPFKVGDFEVTAFETSHDGTDNMGFSLSYGDRKFVLATDMGAVTTRAKHYISEANHLVIESNYDLQMLMTGRYPEHLKARIITTTGHMENEETGRFLQGVYHPGMSHIFLCHLSKENNTPQKALAAVRSALEGIGLKTGNGENTLADRDADVQLVALPRTEPSRWYVFL
ncbi:MAG: MBL fold metallo-hydrolase [Muribaculaceae bacterium]|nr:MBL fold metallo-hydrolase [Muribaculaceae bacterium]